MDISVYVAILIPSLALLVSIIAVWSKDPEGKLPWASKIILNCIFTIGVAVVVIVSCRYFSGENGLLADTGNSFGSNLFPSEQQSSSEDVNATPVESIDTKNEGNEVLKPITYNGGTAMHILSGDVIHFPNFDGGDYTVGGIWSLQPDFTAADTYILVYSCGNVAIKPQNEDRIICSGMVHFGTVWSEDNCGDWEEKCEAYNSPFTNVQMPTESYGTFSVDLPQYAEKILPGNYICELYICLNGGEYTTEIEFTID